MELIALTAATLAPLLFSEAVKEGGKSFGVTAQQGSEVARAVDKRKKASMGNSHFFGSDDKNALTDYNSALKLQPDDVNAYYNRGVAYLNQGNYAQAIADFNQALKLQPNFVEAYNSRGLAYKNQGNYTQAIADFNSALKLQPNNAVVYYNRGNAYDTQGNYTQAIADFNSALKLQPNFVEAYNSRGLA